MEAFINRKPARGTLNKYGRQFYTRHFARLVGEGIVKESDYDGFLELCEFYGIVQELRRAIKAEGELITDRDGNQRKNPAIPRLKDAEAKYLRLSNRYGLNPAARRQREKAAEPVEAKPNELDMFIKAQKWLEETFQDRMNGIDVPMPEDVRRAFNWIPGEKSVYSEAEIEEFAKSAKDGAPKLP